MQQLTLNSHHPELAELTRPELAWNDYLASFVGQRTPSHEDFFERWDAPRYVCPQRGRPGGAKATHLDDQSGPGKCSCGTDLRREGVRGWGEARAYVAWLLEIMELEEMRYFQMIGTALSGVMTAVVMIVRAMLAGEISEVEAGAEAEAEEIAR